MNDCVDFLEFWRGWFCLHGFSVALRCVALMIGNLSRRFTSALLVLNDVVCVVQDL